MAQVDSKKQLVFNIITFLKSCETDHSVPEDSVESLQVAQQCLSDAFGVDADSEEDRGRYELGEGKGLMQVWDVVRNVVQKRVGAEGGAKDAGKVAGDANKDIAKDAKAATRADDDKEPTAQDKSRAEQLKAEGNALISQRLYSSAIEKYTSAITLDPRNAVYYSNRAAAWGAMGEHEEAVKDAREAVRRDERFVRGWSRLGHAQYSLGNYSEAVKAYTQGLTLDPANANMQQALAQAKAKAAAQSNAAHSDSDDDGASDDAGEMARGAPAGGAGGMPDLSALAGMLGNMGGGGDGAGGAGGMPDLAGLMSNPAIMQMAQSMMANGGLDRLMSNPAMRNMAERMSGGGGMPDINALRNDPEMRNLASQFMGGQGQGQ